jgi:hypothetical protein
LAEVDGNQSIEQVQQDLVNAVRHHGNK